MKRLTLLCLCLALFLGCIVRPSAVFGYAEPDANGFRVDNGVPGPYLPSGAPSYAQDNLTSHWGYPAELRLWNVTTFTKVEDCSFLNGWCHLCDPLTYIVILADYGGICLKQFYQFGPAGRNQCRSNSRTSNSFCRP